jgi:hypothetical protein
MELNKDSLRRLITDRTLSPVINVSPSTLRRWRKQGKGPPFRKFGPEPNAPVRYDPADVTEWINSCHSSGDRQHAKQQRYTKTARCVD